MPRTQNKRIVLIEDDPSLARIFGEYLKDEDYKLTAFTEGLEGLAAIESDPPDALILDLKLPDIGGLDILRTVKERGLPTTVVVITADGSINTAVEAMKAGAADFIVKPFNKDRLVYTLRNALERQNLVRIVDAYTDEIEDGKFCGFIGSSPAMRAVYRTIESCAASDATVFITGESGSGKEICAEAIHQLSRRRDRTLVVMNCAAIPSELMEREVFGHVKGAFSGAVSDRDGAAATANGGTLFLDEICEMDINLQAKLLRFVQSGTYQKVGSDKPEKSDIRIISATNKIPWDEVEAGRFREDLYYRLYVIPVELPRLRDRGEDILMIANHFLHQFTKEEDKRFTAFSDRAAQMISAFDWPGNVRQLQNVIRNLVVLNDGKLVEPEMFPPPLDGGGGSIPARPKPHAPQNPEKGTIKPMWQIEHDHIKQVIGACGGNVSKAAALLELSPATIYRRLKEIEMNS